MVSVGNSTEGMGEEGALVWLMRRNFPLSGDDLAASFGGDNSQIFSVLHFYYGGNNLVVCCLSKFFGCQYERLYHVRLNSYK
ncbi:MAG: hypothetical protein F6K39_38805 [Okeania sp. SIO3B3]|nr:hypothetical protein [Okeania sp. SIO3B3]